MKENVEMIQFALRAVYHRQQWVLRSLPSLATKLDLRLVLLKTHERFFISIFLLLNVIWEVSSGALLLILCGSIKPNTA